MEKIVSLLLSTSGALIAILITTHFKEAAERRAKRRLDIEKTVTKFQESCRQMHDIELAIGDEFRHWRISSELVILIELYFPNMSTLVKAYWEAGDAYSDDMSLCTHESGTHGVPVSFVLNSEAHCKPSSYPSRPAYWDAQKDLREALFAEARKAGRQTVWTDIADWIDGHGKSN